MQGRVAKDQVDLSANTVRLDVGRKELVGLAIVDPETGKNPWNIRYRSLRRENPMNWGGRLTSSCPDRASSSLTSCLFP